MDLYIVKVTISFCSILSTELLNMLNSIFGEELNINLSRALLSLLGSKGTNEYIQRAKQAKRAYNAYEDLLMNCQNTVGMITAELILALSKCYRFHFIQT